MRKRMILMLTVMAAFIASIGFVKYRQIQNSIAQASSFQPPPEAVTTVIATEERWQQTARAIGSVEAVQGVRVSADLDGIVAKIAFESGTRVQAGDVLVLLDTRQEDAQLASAEATRALARTNLDRIRDLWEQGVTSRAAYDAATTESDQAEARVAEIRATIERKTIRAPFSGALGIRQVNLGQYLRGGDPVVPLQSLHPIHVNFSVPQQKLGQLKVGRDVNVTAEGMPAAVGRITAIDSVVDEATRNVQAQATLSNPGGRLKPGMFVEVQIVLGVETDAVTIPASAIRHAPYGDSVFIVEALTGTKGETYRGVRQQFVKIGSERGDQVAILAGVEPGAEVVTSGVFKLRNGAAVVVSNDVQPGNDPAPKPTES